MKFPTIIGFMVIFSLLMFSGISVFNEIRADYGLTNTTAGGNFSNIDDYYDNTNALYDDISGTYSSSGDSNFLTDLGAIWRTATSFVSDSFSLMSEFKNNLANDLGINPVILDSISILVIIGLTALLVSVAVRWKVDN